jgi:hypothetical protein
MEKFQRTFDHMIYHLSNVELEEYYNGLRTRFMLPVDPAIADETNHDRFLAIENAVWEMHTTFDQMNADPKLQKVLAALGFDLDDWNDVAEEDPISSDEERYMDSSSADAEALASAGWGTDEDYGYYGEEF